MTENTKNHDLLDMSYIDNLPQPLWDGDFPISDIEVETGLYRIEVCGLSELRGHIGGCCRLKDANGDKVCAGDLYLDPTEWETRGAMT